MSHLLLFRCENLQNELGVDVVKLPEDQYSFQHLKAFGQHNSLVVDRWNDDLVFYVDKNWRLMQMFADVDHPLKEPSEVFVIPNKENQRLSPGRCHVTISFPNKEMALLADGAGSIYLLQTGERKEEKTWQVRYNSDVFGSDAHPITLMDSVTYAQTENESQTTHCDFVLLNIEDNPRKVDVHKSPFVTKLTWISIVSDDQIHWRETRRRQLSAASVPDLVTSQSRGQGLFIASQLPFRLVSDSDQPEVELMNAEENEIEEQEVRADPLYNWSQTEEDVTACFVLPDMTSSNDITYNLTSTSIDLGIRDKGTLLRGDLFAGVKTDESTWTLIDGRLDLLLIKQQPGLWTELIPGDRTGRLVLDPEQLAELDDIASSLRAEPSSQGTPYNAQELEDVDAYPDDTAILVRVDGTTNCVSHKAFLSSHQWLFNTRIQPDQPRALCLRHDVDGLLWQPTDDPESPWKHTATFNAFGYVQASKRERKFSACAPDFSYSVVCDCIRHVYIYRQHSPTNTPLRNRKTGENVKAIAKQQLVSLDSVDTILGMRCTNEKLYLLTEKQFYAVRVNVSEMV